MKKEVFGIVFFLSITLLFLNLGYAAELSLVTSLNGTDESGIFGKTVAAGDFNGDGFNDVFAASGPGDVGTAYVFFSNNGIVPNMNKTEANLTINGTNRFYLGDGLASGDINGDGYDDFIVGAPVANGSGPEKEDGQLYVFYGADYNENLYLTWESANITINSTAKQEYIGARITTGDINGDGYDDIITSGYAAPGGPSGGSFYGIVWVFFGENFTTTINDTPRPKGRGISLSEG